MKKYFEKGHTFIRADSVYGSIAKMQKYPEICRFQGFVDFCEKSRVKIKPIIIQYHDFYEFEDGRRNRKFTNIALPRLDSIAVVEFRKCSRAMWIKHALEEDYLEDNFLKTKFRLDITPRTK